MKPVAKLAYLTTPAPDRYILNIQPHWSEDLFRFEISKAHLINILIDGTALALRESNHRVPINKTKEERDEMDRTATS